MLLINPYRFATPRIVSTDADVNAYILAVEAADGQELEADVITAVEDFVIGCKSDGIWSAIKASCILVGARTLNGALVPLVGSAPTNNNFVSGDYDREMGLIGQNSTAKFIDSNRANDADPQNDYHQSVFISTIPSTDTYFRGQIGAGGSNNAGTSSITSYNGSLYFRCRQPGGSKVLTGEANFTGLKGMSRSSAENYIARSSGSNTQFNVTSAFGVTNNIQIFRNNSQNRNSDARISFYSIGESLDLADLDTRVSTLMTDLAAAI